MADNPRLKIAIATYGHTKALKSSEVKIAGVRKAEDGERRYSVKA